MTTGQRIKDLRKARHMTQMELAKRAFVTKQAVSMWESDKCALSLTSAQLLCDIFNVEMDYLMCRQSVTMRYLNTEEMNIIDAYRQQPEAVQEAICKMLDVKKGAESTNSQTA